MSVYFARSGSVLDVIVVDEEGCVEHVLVTRRLGLLDGLSVCYFFRRLIRTAGFSEEYLTRIEDGTQGNKFGWRMAGDG